MTKINFENIEIFNDIARTSCSVVNVKKDFANLLYNNASGLAYHALALKIYNSEGETEYNDEECELIKAYAERCTPAFMDAINNVLNNKKEE